MRHVIAILVLAAAAVGTLAGEDTLVFNGDNGDTLTFQPTAKPAGLRRIEAAVKSATLEKTDKVELRNYGRLGPYTAKHAFLLPTKDEEPGGFALESSTTLWVLQIVSGLADDGTVKFGLPGGDTVEFAAQPTALCQFVSSVVARNYVVLWTSGEGGTDYERPGCNYVAAACKGQDPDGKKEKAYKAACTDLRRLY